MEANWTNHLRYDSRRALSSTEPVGKSNSYQCPSTEEQKLFSCIFLPFFQLNEGGFSQNVKTTSLTPYHVHDIIDISTFSYAIHHASEKNHNSMHSSMGGSQGLKTWVPPFYVSRFSFLHCWTSDFIVLLLNEPTGSHHREPQLYQQRVIDCTCGHWYILLLNGKKRKTRSVIQLVRKLHSAQG